LRGGRQSNEAIYSRIWQKIASPLHNNKFFSFYSKGFFKFRTACSKVNDEVFSV